MPSGWNANFPNDMIWDVAVLSHVPVATRTPLFVTRGGNVFKRQMERRKPPFDGYRSPIARHNRKVGSNPIFQGTSLQLDETLLPFFEPGSTIVTVAGPPAVTTVTPLPHGIAIPKTALIKLPQLRWMRSGVATGVSPGFVDVIFPLGDVIEWDINAKDKDEGEISFTIEANLDPDAVGFDTDDEPYSIVITDPV